MKLKKIIPIAVIAFLVLFVVGALIFYVSVNPTKDEIEIQTLPLEFFCESGDNYIDYQTGRECAAYASAFVLRHLGKNISGKELYPQIKRTFGFVPAKSIVGVFEKYGYFAKAYHGNTESLKKRLCEGVPVIAFVTIPNDTHYLVVVGYDENYFYFSDSLKENKNADKKEYNRKLTAEEFEKIWKTNTLLSDNIYIVVNPVSK